MPLISPCVGVIYPSREYPIIPGCPKTVWQPTISNRAGFLCHSTGESHSHRSPSLPQGLSNLAHLWGSAESERSWTQKLPSMPGIMEEGGVGGEGRILGLLECAERERGLLCHRKRKRPAGHEHFSAHSIAMILFLWYCFYNTNTMIGMHWTGTTLWEDSTEWMGELQDRDGESEILESSCCQSVFEEYCELHCSVCQPLSIKCLLKWLTRWSLTWRNPEVKRIRRSLSLENYDITIVQTLLNLSRQYKDLVLTCVGCWTWIQN